MSALEASSERLLEAESSPLGREDPGTIALVRRLLARARAVDGAARERLVRLADERLREARERAEAEARRLAAPLRELGEGAAPYEAALETGEILSVARALSRVKRGGRRLLGRPRAARVEEPASAARASERPSLTPPPLPMHRYRAAAAEAEAEIALLRSKRNVPEVAGRYHGGAVGAEALQTMERVGRAYLVAQLSRFEAYAAVFSLAAELEPKAAPRAKKAPKKKNARRGSAGA